ncbi:Hypothetical predicted protein [Mytilus galloprovincialis]|uniref:Fibronectin type-III domain-containing protein n=1 Tax=Mytilus galloprovincialis TaxID=29158 RepID=A0A8B6D5P8_MYTGA|nr:Hypothetical predicted protein [Mytilus galloprovincialis]VDI15549.1 Hypothetical predicted protein [Mytilus galloprovincialis]
MGANNSLAEDDPRRNFDHKDKYTTSAKYRLSYHGISNAKGKPPPPEGTPSLRNITHNSLTVVWSPPQGQRIDTILAYRVEIYNATTRRWKVVTSCCQGNSYDVKDLKPDSEYCLRIRAENLFGWSKPSQSTHLVRTRSLPNRRSMFEQEEAKNTKLVRRHSYHIKIEANVATMLFNKTEESGNCNNIGTFPMRRNGSTRMSLPIQRRTVASLIPGSRRESTCSIRDTRRRSVEESSVCTDETDESLKSLKLHRISMSTEEDSCARSTSSTSMSSIPELQEEDSFEHLECKNNREDYWRQNWTSPTHEVSHDDILTSPYSDDTKLSMFSRSPMQRQSNHFSDYPKTNKLSPYDNDSDSQIWKGKDDGHLDNESISDLRSLRDILCSNEMMVKTLNADNNGNYCNKLYNNVIHEVDEENVMIDRVSTL